MMLNRYLTPMLVIAVAIGVYFLYIDKAYKGIAQQLAREEVIEGFLLDAQNAKDELDKIIAEHRSFPPGADHKLEVFLPNTLDPAQVVVDVNAIAEKYGLILRAPKVMLGKPNLENPTPYLAHSIEFTMLSTYPVLRNFLRDVERSLAIRDFESLKLTPEFFDQATESSPVDPEFQLFDYKITLKTYSLE